MVMIADTVTLTDSVSLLDQLKACVVVSLRLIDRDPGL
jgi:hypothetical protein